MKLLAKLEKNLNCWFLIATSFVFFLLRLPSLFEPYWYGDEGIYQVLGIGMNAGRLLYRDIFDNKPPLLYFLYSLVNGDQFAIRLLSLIAGLLTVIVFFFLAKRIFENQRAVFLSTGLFALLFGLPLVEGNIANAENFMLLPNIISGILILKSLGAEGQKRYRLLLISGLVLGISFLFKIVAIFDFAAFVVFLVFANYPGKLLEILKVKNLAKELKNSLPFIAAFVLPIILITLFFFLTGAFSYFLKAVLFNNVGYVGYGNKFIIPQGFLILKLSLLSLFMLFLFAKRISLGNNFVFVSIWLAFSLFDAYFSQRPYTHYVLVLLPAFCLMFGFMALDNKIRKTAGILTVSTFIVVLLSFNFYIKTVFYYQNFLSFIIGNKSVYAYQRFFDRNTPNDYDIAGYIKMNASQNDNIFIWGNNAQVYKLTDKLPPGRYTVAYHITNYKDGYENTSKGLEKSKPRFIVVMPNTVEYPFSLSNYYQKIEFNKIKIYEKLPN